jgi:hypothetical protein
MLRVRTVRLDTASFRDALNEATGETGSNGWSLMLKDLVTALAQNQKSSVPTLVSALSRLIEEADKAGVLFESNAVKMFLNFILDQELVSVSPPPVAVLYWSIMSTLAKTSEYFRAIGREAAQSLCSRLTSLAWESLLPDADAEVAPGGSPPMPAKASPPARRSESTYDLGEVDL